MYALAAAVFLEKSFLSVREREDTEKEKRPTPHAEKRRGTAVVTRVAAR